MSLYDRYSKWIRSANSAEEVEDLCAMLADDEHIGTLTGRECVQLRELAGNVADSLYYGREAVAPLESNTGWMDTLADMAAARMGGQGGSGQPIRVQVILDGKVVAESTVRQLRNQARGRNYPLAELV